MSVYFDSQSPDVGKSVLRQLSSTCSRRTLCSQPSSSPKTTKLAGQSLFKTIRVFWLRFSLVFLSFEWILWNSQGWSKASFREASTEVVFPQNRRGHYPMRSQFLWVHCPDMNTKVYSQITGCPMGVPSVNSNRICGSFKMFVQSLFSEKYKTVQSLKIYFFPNSLLVQLHISASELEGVRNISGSLLVKACSNLPSNS